MAEPMHCDACGKPIPPHTHYVVRIDVFADPSVPELSTKDLQKMQADESVEDLVAQMEGLSEDDLNDLVHRHFEYTLCRACHARFLANPLGKPRVTRAGRN